VSSVSRRCSGTASDPEETKGFFKFLDAVFPDARYILHRRDHDQVSTSGFWNKREPKDVEQALLRVEDIQDHLRKTRPERVLETRYERLTSNDPAEVDAELRKLTEFVLGECDNAILARLRETMGVGFGPHPFRGRETG